MYSSIGSTQLHLFKLLKRCWMEIQSMVERKEAKRKHRPMQSGSHPGCGLSSLQHITEFISKADQGSTAQGTDRESTSLYINSLQS